MKPKTKKILIRSAFSLLLIGLAVGVFFATYYMTSKKSYASYETDIKKIIDDIIKVDNTTGNLIKSPNIDVDKSKKELNDKISSLTNIMDNLNNLNPTDKYVKLQDNLYQGLLGNINMFKQIDYALNNPQAKDLDTALENLKTYKDQCIKYYGLVKFKDAKISLPSICVSYVNNCVNYLTDFINKNKEKQISKSQTLDFIDNIDNLTSKFSALKIDYSTYISKARSKSESYDNILSTLDKNSDSFEQLRQDLIKITLPPDNKNASGVSNILKKTFDDYSLYMKDFRYALVSEKAMAASTSFKKETADSLYKDANSDFDAMSKDYNDFLMKYSDFKTSFVK